MTDAIERGADAQAVLAALQDLDGVMVDDYTLAARDARFSELTLSVTLTHPKMVEGTQNDS